MSTPLSPRRPSHRRRATAAAPPAAWPRRSSPSLHSSPLTQAAEAKKDPPAVPSQIQVGPGHKVFLVGHAVGVQIYSCNATAGGFAWAFVAPRANLYDDHGRLTMTHFGGPTWQARDGSSVVGSVWTA